MCESREDIFRKICSIDSNYVGCFNDVKEDLEYINLSAKDSPPVGTVGISNYLNELSKDKVVKQIDMSYNITLDEAYLPGSMIKFLDDLEAALKINDTVISLDLAGNHIGNFGPSSFNNHLPKHSVVLETVVKNVLGRSYNNQKVKISSHPIRSKSMIQDYIVELSEILINSSIVRIDLSDNCITGDTGRKLSGFGYFIRKYVKSNCQVLKFRSNRLHSHSVAVLTEGLGAGSLMEHLDISDNLIGLSPNFEPSSTGIGVLMHALSNTKKIRVLKLARNAIRDDDLLLISAGLQTIPTLEVLDLQGNYIHSIGMEYMKKAIVGHGSFDHGSSLGLKDLNFSFNPIGDLGAQHLSEAISLSDTIIALHLESCEISDLGMSFLLKTLSKNSSILWLEISNNYAKPLITAETSAEAEANRNLQALRKDYMSINTGKLTKPVYIALKNKLHLLDKQTLISLHSNPSFNVPQSTMKESLHCVQPPSRRTIFSEVVSKDLGFTDRIKLSVELEKKIFCGRKISRNVMKWYRVVQAQNRIKAALKAQKKKLEEEDAINMASLI